MPIRVYIFTKYVTPIFGYIYKGKFSIKPTHPFLRKKWSKKLLLFVLGISKALLIMKAVPPTMNNASLWCHFFVHFLVYNNTMSFNAFLDNMDTTGEYSTKIQDVMKNNHKTILYLSFFISSNTRKIKGQHGWFFYSKQNLAQCNASQFDYS